MGIGDWGLGDGDWGLGQSPIPNPQSPIPNPQSPSQYLFNKIYFLSIIFLNLIDIFSNIINKNLIFYLIFFSARVHFGSMFLVSILNKWL